MIVCILCLCFVFCVLCSVFCVLCFVFCVLCFVFCVLCLCFVFCVLCFVFCKKHKDRYGMSNDRLCKECVWCDHKKNKTQNMKKKNKKNTFPL